MKKQILIYFSNKIKSSLLIPDNNNNKTESPATEKLINFLWKTKFKCPFQKQNYILNLRKTQKFVYEKYNLTKKQHLRKYLVNQLFKKYNFAFVMYPRKFVLF